MPLGLRDRLFLLRARAEVFLRPPRPLEAYTPAQLLAACDRVLFRGPQPPAPFDLVFKPTSEGVYILPKAVEPNPYG